MKISKITYSMGQTIQMKDFHPRSFHVSLEAELGEDDKYMKVHEDLKRFAQAMIKEDIQEAEAKKKELTTEANNKIQN